MKVTDNSSRWKPQINDDSGDILPTRSPYIIKNQCQTDGASLSLAAVSVMCENFMLSMTQALHCVKNKARLSTQKEQHYFPPFTAVSLPEENVCGSAKVIAFGVFGEKKMYASIHCVRLFLSRPVTEQMFGNVSSAWARGKQNKILHFNKTTAVWRCGRMCSLNYYTSAAAFNKEWLTLRAWYLVWYIFIKVNMAIMVLWVSRYSHTVTTIHFLLITWSQRGPDDVMALCVINIERSFPLLGCRVYHILGSISNLPQDCLGHFYYLSGKRLPNSVIEFFWKLADYFFYCILWSPRLGQAALCTMYCFPTAVWLRSHYFQ